MAKEKRSGLKRFFLFTLIAGGIAALVTFFRRRRTQSLEESEWQELPPPEGA